MTDAIENDSKRADHVIPEPTIFIVRNVGIINGSANAVVIPEAIQKLLFINTKHITYFTTNYNVLAPQYGTLFEE